MIYENTGGVPNVMAATGSGDHDRHGMNYMWVFALVIIFFAVILWGRNDRRNDGVNESILPALVASKMADCNYQPKNGYISHELWDVERDNLSQFATVRQEMKDTAWTQERENSKYFYEQRAAIDRNNYDTLLGFKNNEILGLQNTKEVLGRIDGLERRLDQDIIRKQGEELTQIRTVMGVRGLGSIPAYIPPYGIPDTSSNLGWC